MGYYPPQQLVSRAMREATCEYCRSRGSGQECRNCGAPLPVGPHYSMGWTGGQVYTQATAVYDQVAANARLDQVHMRMLGLIAKEWQK